MDVISRGPTLLRWSRGALAPRDPAPDDRETLLVADSWLVADGTMLGLDAHHERFLQGVRDTTALDGSSVGERFGGAIDEIDVFWAAAIAALPRDGAWFPRVELIETPVESRLQLRLRPAPLLGRSVTAAVWPGEDPRRRPTVKGYDLVALQHTREWAQTLSTDEALIAPDGALVEGATTAIMWWRGDRLCFVPTEGPQAPPRIASITEHLVRTIAATNHVQAEPEVVQPADLVGCEVWALNALHGIRLVERLLDADGREIDVRSPSGRIDHWRSQLARQRRTLPSIPETILEAS